MTHTGITQEFIDANGYSSSGTFCNNQGSCAGSTCEAVTAQNAENNDPLKTTSTINVLRSNKGFNLWQWIKDFLGLK
jgi:hypothetical protein